VLHSHSRLALRRLFESCIYLLQATRRGGAQPSAVVMSMMGTRLQLSPTRLSKPAFSLCLQIGKSQQSLSSHSMKRLYMISANNNTTAMEMPTSTRTNSTDHDNNHIIVIGAGVLGLSTCTLLQSRFPRRRITLLAAELPSTSTSASSAQSGNISASYASAWAGAHYRPIFPSTPQLKMEFQLAQSTFEVMKRIAVETPEAGVGLMQGVEFLDEPGEGELGMMDGDVYAGVGDGFRVLRGEELMEGVKWGCEYGTYCVNVPIYCRWLLGGFEKRGGIVLRRRIGDVVEAFDVAKDQDEVGGDVSMVINCSGTNFGHDAKVKIIRGQTCLVKNPYHRTVTRQYADGRWATLIPRPLEGGTIVGVSKEIGDQEEKSRPETRQQLLEQSIECFPDFVKKLEEFEVLRDNVGRRPFREGGLRVEVEGLEDGRKRIIHGYGAGGRGYELSWGIAQQVVEMVSSTNTAKDEPVMP
jgi:D-amino-acid oxidase